MLIICLGDVGFDQKMKNSKTISEKKKITPQAKKKNPKKLLEKNRSNFFLCFYTKKIIIIFKAFSSKNTLKKFEQKFKF